MNNFKLFNIIVIFCIILLIHKTEAHSLRKLSKDYHEELNQEADEAIKHLVKRHMKSHHHIDTLLNRLIEIESENSASSFRNLHHQLKKGHEKRGISIERENDEILAEFESSRFKRARVVDVPVKQVANSSSCNYTVSFVKNPGDLILPKNLVHITCKEKGAECGADMKACCLQTYTNIQVARRNSDDTQPMRINTGCVCALQLSSPSKKFITQPFIDSS